MKVVDLFAGCGGLSYGFKLAGFETLLALERDQWASETYQANHPYVNIITGDITQISDPQSLVEFPVDGVIGGPPCQGYSCRVIETLKTLEIVFLWTLLDLSMTFGLISL